MSLQRVLEPEVMDTPEEATDYNEMDHAAVNSLFVDDLLQFASAKNCGLTSILDLGTGTALIPIELCKANTSCHVTAIDMAANMLALAKTNVSAADLAQRISLQRVDAKSMPYADQRFDCAISNSIIHHIPHPVACLSELVRVTAPAGIIFVRDLMRPASADDVANLVKLYAGDENEHCRKMFDDSLRAALSLTEIREMVAQFGFDPKSVAATSDRHWTWAAVKH